MTDYTIGIDIGGTRTHAVLYADGNIIGSVDVATTPDTRQCVREAIHQLLSAAQVDAPHLDANDITSVMIGTTRFVNDILQQKCLNKVFTLRLAAPETTALPPAADWPESLKNLIGNHHAIISGGYEFHGGEITPLNPSQVVSAAQQALEAGIRCIAVSGVFSHVDATQELQAYELLKAVDKDFNISLSHQVGEPGFIARENATILNAALSTAFKSFCRGIRQALVETGLAHARFYLSSNHGTIERVNSMLPVQTYNSGPSNSIRGAARLAPDRSTCAVVIDVGGTSSDAGIARHGFPLPSGTEIKIGNEHEGFICNFPSPLTLSCALGGGSIISVNDNQLTIGPESVGFNLRELGVGFGGNVLTVTDIAIATGRVKNFGDASLLKDIPPDLIEKADDAIHVKLAGMIQAILPYIDAQTNVPVILVGGGACLFDLNRLKNILGNRVGDIIIPPYASSANAVGAAVAKINGRFSKVYQYQDTPVAKGISREDALQDARQRAIQDAIAKGANPASINELGVTEIPMNYLPGALHCLMLEVTGDYLPSRHSEDHYIDDVSLSESLPDAAITGNAEETKSSLQDEVQEFKDLALGGSFLGSGGGGSTYLSEILFYNCLKKNSAPQIIKLHSIPDEMQIVAVAAIGAPTVGHEKPPSMYEMTAVIETMKTLLGTPLDAIVAVEGAGFNAIYPFSIALANKLPVIDADCMGRAFPRLSMTTPWIYGGDSIAMIAVLANGSTTEVIQADNLQSLNEKVGEVLTNRMGGTATIACMPMNGKQARLWCIPHTLSFARRLGAATRSSQISETISALTEACLDTGYGPVTSIGSGRIIELNRGYDNGFSKGWLIIESNSHGNLKIEFQNENLRVINCTTNHVMAIVPDIITLLDVKGQPIPCELLRTGLEVTSIMVIGAPAILKTPEALKAVGAEQFDLKPLTHVRETPGISLYPYSSGAHLSVEQPNESYRTECQFQGASSSTP